jgi:phosphoenolpyruvate---glycerone phosphotransferase subunit DhaL
MREESGVLARGIAGSTGGEGGRDVDLKRRLISAVATDIIAHAEELTALDAVIGDGDHGHNMRRGFQAVLDDAEALSAASWPDLLKGVGMRLVAKVGGASGPLYGTLFLALGKEIPANPSRDDVATALTAAIAAVKARGKSDVGQKTMIDVLVPACQAFVNGSDLAFVRKAATQAAEATIPMRAIRGRASFLGDRSIGHIDPGARSSSLMIATICNEMGET